jgi:hypothetical protein
MDNVDAHLLCDQSCGSGGVHIPDHDHRYWPDLVQYGFNPFHDLGRLLGVGSGPDIQVTLRVRNTKIAEKLARHVVVIVLAGVNQ